MAAKRPSARRMASNLLMVSVTRFAFTTLRSLTLTTWVCLLLLVVLLLTSVLGRVLFRCIFLFRGLMPMLLTRVLGILALLFLHVVCHLNLLERRTAECDGLSCDASV